MVPGKDTAQKAGCRSRGRSDPAPPTVSGFCLAPAPEILEGGGQPDNIASNGAVARLWRASECVQTAGDVAAEGRYQLLQEAG